MQARPRGWPHRLALLPLILLTLWLAVAAFAQDDDEDEEPGAFREYLGERANNFKGGLNGLITWPADPVMRTVDPPEALAEWWPPFNYLTSFLAGTLEGIYRLTMGACDIVFTPIPRMPMLSPLPRYKLVPFEHEDE